MVRRSSLLPLIGIALPVAGATAAAAILTEGALHPPRRPVPAPPSISSAAITPVSIAARDGAVLRAWLFSPRVPNGAAVVAMHGIGDNRASMVAIADVLAREGYVVLAPDARAHGESGGAMATYGVHEADDVRRWAALLRSRVTGCVFGFGESLGAALLLQANEVFCGIVAESAFPNFADVAADRIRQRLPVDARIARPIARAAARAGMSYARLRYGVDLTAAAPDRLLGATHVPIMLIHGTGDALAPVEYGERLRSRSPASIALWIVPDAAHTQAWAAAGGEFPRRVVRFLNDHR